MISNPYRTVARQGDVTCNIGHIYLNSKDETDKVTPETKQLLIDWINDEYSLMKENHPNLDINYTSITEEPSLSMLDDVFTHESRSLDVFNGGTSSPLFSYHVNVRFRAVHDWHHWIARAEFDFTGEMKAFKLAVESIKLFCEMYEASEETIAQAVSVLYSEIVLQVAAHNLLGDYPKDQKIVLCAIGGYL